MADETPQESAQRILAALCSQRSNRAFLAQLRWLSRGELSRAWAAAAQLGIVADQTGQMIAGWYGSHPSNADTLEPRDIGCWLSSLGGEGKSDGMKRRFDRLLKASSREEMTDLLGQFVRFSASQRVPVPYGAIYVALRYFSPNTRERLMRDLILGFTQ